MIRAMVSRIGLSRFLIMPLALCALALIFDLMVGVWSKPAEVSNNLLLFLAALCIGAPMSFAIGCLGAMALPLGPRLRWWISGFLLVLVVSPVGIMAGPWHAPTGGIVTLAGAAVVDILRWSPLIMLFAYGARLSIPDRIYRSAESDEAEQIAIMYALVWPAMRGPLVFLFALRMLFGLVEAPHWIGTAFCAMLCAVALWLLGRKGTWERWL